MTNRLTMRLPWATVHESAPEIKGTDFKDRPSFAGFVLPNDLERWEDSDRLLVDVEIICARIHELLSINDSVALVSELVATVEEGIQQSSVEMLDEDVWISMSVRQISALFPDPHVLPLQCFRCMGAIM